MKKKIHYLFFALLIRAFSRADNAANTRMFKYKYARRNLSCSIKYDLYKGARRMKLIGSNEIRTLRDICVFEVNGWEVYM